jgi:hypothetical protein
MLSTTNDNLECRMSGNVYTYIEIHLQVLICLTYTFQYSQNTLTPFLNTLKYTLNIVKYIQNTLQCHVYTTKIHSY